MEQPHMLHILYCQYHSCWCLGNLRSQGISRNGIDPQSRSILSPALEEKHGGKLMGLDVIFLEAVADTINHVEFIFFRSQCINSLCLSGAIWQHRSRSTLAQIMPCCLMAPSHYLKQCWLLIEVLCHSPESNFTESAWVTILCNGFENYTFKIIATYPGGWCVKNTGSFSKPSMSMF